MTTLWYRDGTVAVTAGSKVVTGTDTLWKYAEILDAGDIFTLDGTRLFEVASIDSDTQLTLTEDFVGTTGAGRSYSIIPNYAVRPYAPIIGRQMLLINKWLTREQELTDWQAAPASSDPANPTKVTLTSWEGIQGTYYSLPQLLSMIGAAMDWTLLTNVPANITAWQSINPSTKQDFAPNLVDWSATTLASMAPRQWVDDNYVSLTGDTMTGDLLMQSGAGIHVLDGGSLRSSGWGGVSTSGVVFLGDANSYLFKNGNQFDFAKSDANGQAAWAASLKQGGDILTTDGNQIITGTTRMNGALTVGARFFAGGTVDADAGYQIVMESGVAYLDAKSRDGSLLKDMKLRGTTLTFNGNPVYTTANFNPGNYLPLTGGDLTGNVTSTGSLVIKNSIRVQDWGTTDDGVLFFGTKQSYIYKPGEVFQFTNVDGATPWTAYLKRAGDIMTSLGDFTLSGIFQSTWVRALGASSDTVYAEIRPGNTGEAWFQAVTKATGAPTGKMFYRGDSHTWTQGNGNIVGSLNNAGLLSVSAVTATGLITAKNFNSSDASATSLLMGTLNIGDSFTAKGVTYIGGRVNNTGNKIRIYNHDANLIAIDSTNWDASTFAPVLFRATEFRFSGGRTLFDTHLNSTANAAVLSANGSGTIYLRPNGADNNGGATVIDTNGNMTVAGSVWLRGNTRNFKAFDNNNDISCIDIGSGINNATDRGGYITNRNANGSLLLSGRNNAVRLQLGPDGNYAHVNQTFVSQPDSAITPDNMSTLAFQARGSFGGGYSMRDNAGAGIYWGGMWMAGGSMYMGVSAANHTQTTQTFIMKPDGQVYVTGNQFNVEGSSPTIRFWDADEGYTSWIHNNNGTHGFLQHNAFAWGCYRDSSNNWCSVGNIIAYASDARLKKNPRALANPIQKLAMIEAVEFDWDIEACDIAGFTPQRPTEHGVLAQQLQRVFPDMVVPAPFNKEYLTVMYDRLSVFNLAVNKHQQAVIEGQAAKIIDQEERLRDLELKMAKLMARMAVGGL